MNAAHLHLVVNHLPVIGSIVALLILAYSLLRRSDELTRLALVLFVVAAFLGIAVYLTGEPAEDIAEKLPGVTHAAIEEHEDAALFAAWLLGAIGVLSISGLLIFGKRPGGIPRRFSFVVLILSLFPVAAMIRTANLGGMIRHTEIRADTTGAGVVEERHR